MNIFGIISDMAAGHKILYFETRKKVYHIYFKIKLSNIANLSINIFKMAWLLIVI